MDVGDGEACPVFVVLGEAAAAAEPCEGAFDQHPYNVAKFAYEWSSLIERPLGLVVASRDRDASRFVAGGSEPQQDLMRHRRATFQLLADRGADSPAQRS